MFGWVRLDRSVLDLIDRRLPRAALCGPGSIARERRAFRRKFIAEAVARECGRQAAGGGVIVAESSDAPLFTPEGLLGETGAVPPEDWSRPLFPVEEVA